LMLTLIGKDGAGKGGIGLHRHGVFGDRFQRWEEGFRGGGGAGCDLKGII
jgi:hypothetical protein